jgi:hypothetical protein
MKGLNYDAFICYSHKDAEIANAIDDHLRNAGISTFFFANILLPGESFQETVVNIINSSRLIIFLCTPHSIQSNWVKNEVAYAINLGKTVVPIIIDDTELPDDMRFLLAGFQHFHIHMATLGSDVKDIVIRLKYWFGSRVESRESLETPLESHIGTSEERDTTVCAVPALPQSSRKGGFIKVLTYIGIAIGVLFYLFTLAYSFDTSNYLQALALLSPLIIGALAFAYLRSKSRKYELKIYCEAEDDRESTLTVTLDDKIISSLKGRGMVRLNEKKGDYLISIESENPEFVSEIFTHSFSKENDKKLKHIVLKQKSSFGAESAKEISSEVTEFTCFIAGSTRLINERNATRAVLSILYNKWESHNLVISSYTFEDFSNSYSTGGQQIRYNEFIKEKATCAIFIVTENVGDKTLEEYRLSIDTFNKNHKRPKVFVYANNLSDSKTTQEFIEEVKKNNSYWREYFDLQQLMSLIKEDIDSELFNIFIFKNGFKK